MSISPQPSDDTSAPGSVDPRIQRSRVRLLEAATDLLVESGPQAVTVDAVAERSGVAKSTLYRHWGSIESLLVDTFRCAAPPSGPIKPAASFEECLRQHVLEIADTLADPKWRRILPSLLALRNHLPAIAELTNSDRAEKIESIHHVLRQGAIEGRIPDDLDPEFVAFTLIGPMVLCAVSEDTSHIREVGLYALERFLASYDCA